MGKLAEIWHRVQQQRPDANELVKCCLPDGTTLTTTDYQLQCVLSNSDYQLVVQDGIHYLCEEDSQTQLGKSLAKSANRNHSRLDQPASFGELLQAQYLIQSRRHEL